MKEIFLAQNLLKGVESPLSSPEPIELINFIFDFFFKTIIISIICLILVFLLSSIKESLINFISETISK